MVRIVRHRQTKGPATDRPNLTHRATSRLHKLTFAPFLARLDDADVPGLIFGVDGAKPPPADAAVGRCGRIAGLSHG
jgi:hypothetical protein